MTTSSPTTSASAAPSAAPGRVRLLLAQVADGAGARFHVVALSLYVLAQGGLASVSGFVASGLVGSVVAVAVAAGLSRLVSGRVLMAGAAGLLLTSRLGAYALVGLQAAPVAFMVSQFVGSVAGTVLVNCSKAQAPSTDRVRMLAWMGVANGAGGVLGATVAGTLSGGWSTSTLVAVGAGAAVVATAPLLVLSRRSVTVPVSLRAQFRVVRRVAGPVVLGGAVFCLAGGLDLLRQPLVSEWYGASFIGVLAGAAFVGSALAAASVGHWQRWSARMRPWVGWPLLGIAPLLLWGGADRSVGWMIAAVAVGAFAFGWLAASVEARVLDTAGGAGVAGLTLSGSVASLLSAGTVTGAPLLLDHVGTGAIAAGAVATLLATGVAGHLAVLARRRRRRATRPAVATA